MLIVVEQYQVGFMLARVLGYHTSDNGCFSNHQRDTICCTSGQLYRYTPASKEAYTWDTPERFNVLPTRVDMTLSDFRVTLGQETVDSITLRNAICGLMQQHDVIVNACGWHEDGERCFYDLFNAAQTHAHVYRLNLSYGLTKRLICDAFSSMADAASTKPLYYAASARMIADCAHSLLTPITTYFCRQGQLHPLLSGYRQAQSSVLSVGRLQIPALSLVATRCAKVENQSRLTLTLPVLSTKIGRYRCDFDYDATLSHTEDSHLAQSRLASEYLARRHSMSMEARVVESLVEGTDTEHPALFSTSTLQSEMRDIALSDTMTALHSLYLKGLITYPITDETLLPRGHYNHARLILLLESLQENPVFSEQKDWNLASIVQHLALTPNLGCLATTSMVGPAPLVPTDAHAEADSLSEIEMEVYRTLCQRFCDVLRKPKKRQFTVTISIEFEEETLGVLGEPHSIFTCQRLVPYESEQLAQLKQGDRVTIESLRLVPQQQHTHQYYRLNDLPQVLQQAGLGLPASRHRIAGALLNRNYVEVLESGAVERLVITQKGLALLDVLPDSFTSPTLVGDWEHLLNKIKGATELTQVRCMRDEFARRIFKHVQGLCQLLNAGLISAGSQNGELPSSSLLEQVKQRAEHLNLLLSDSVLETRKTCIDFLLANRVSYHKHDQFVLGQSGLSVDTDTLKDTRRVALRQAQSKYDKAPSRKQLHIASVLAHRVKLKVPESAKKSAQKCSEFIDLCQSKRRPTPAQIMTLKSLAAQLRFVLDKSVLNSRRETQKLTSELKKRQKRLRKQ